MCINCALDNQEAAIRSLLSVKLSFCKVDAKNLGVYLLIVIVTSYVHVSKHCVYLLDFLNIKSFQTHDSEDSNICSTQFTSNISTFQKRIFIILIPNP